MAIIGEDLNEAQRRAVEAGDGPVLIVAGPGTGKTKTLAARIVWLLENGRAKPDEIVALTFTNKAAREMRERVEPQLGHSKKLPKITTFHALGADILKKQGSKEELLDERQRSDIIRELPRPVALKGTSIRELSLLISRSKTSIRYDSQLPSSRTRSGIQSNTSGRSATSFSTRLRLGGRNDESDDAIDKLLRHYETALADQGLHDFDDLLTKSFELLSPDSSKRPNYKYLLVDEFQDTNELQYEILKLLSQDENIFVIGDPKQSIYSFRGAGAEMFDRFRSDFPNAMDVDLTVNYRSMPEVISLANVVFPNEPKLSGFQKQKGIVKTVQTLNEYSEADYVLREIEQGIGGSDMLKASGHTEVNQPRDYAVLYRTHRAATVVQRAFEAAGVPYQITGEGSPYERPEIRAAIAMMRAVHSPTDATKAELVKYHNIGNANITQINTLLVKYKDINNLSVCDLSKDVAGSLGIGGSKHFEQFFGSLVQFGTCQKGLALFLKHFDSLSESEFYDPTVNAVTLLTIHAAKGLEFNNVFLIAAEDGVLPKITKSAETNLEEERRLFYVAVTRAKQNLEIIYARFRGSETSEPSRFIDEIPNPVLPRTTDPNMQQLERRATKRRQKRAQSSLF